MLIINNVLIEARPRLEACQVYVVFSNIISDDDIRIRIKHNRLCFSLTSSSSSSDRDDNDDDDEPAIELDKYNFIADSITGVTRQSNAVSFRVTVKLRDAANATTAFNMNEFIECLKYDYEQTSGSIFCPFKSPDHVDKAISLLCRTCDRALFDQSRTFKRFLPLPSDGAMEIGDMFCHSPSSSSCSSSVKPRTDEANNNKSVSSSTSSTTMTAAIDAARQYDFLYGDCYFHIKLLLPSSDDNDDNIARNKKKTEEDKDEDRVLRCDSCRSWIGIKIGADELKLWYSTVKLEINANEEQYELRSPLQDFTVSLKKALSSLIFSKRILSMKCPLDGTRTRYLFLLVIDRNLETYQYDISSSSSSSSSNSSTSNDKKKVLNLSEQRSMKILFEFRENDRYDDDAKNKSSFKLNDDNNAICEIDISEPMLNAAKETLFDSHNKLPEFSSIVENLRVTYLNID